MSVRVPAKLAEGMAHEQDWLEALPALASECAELWRLELEEPFETPHALVVPAGDVVLKLNVPSHFEADHEPDALELWGGRGAVRLVERDDARRALLLERCVPGDQLWETANRGAADEAGVVTELLSRLGTGVDTEHPFRFLADEAERWADELPGRRPAPERPLLELAVDVYRSVDGSARFLVNQDLHGANILRAEREPWLLIDPKPLVGERELDAVGLLRNAAAGRAPGPSVSEWLDVLRDLGFDRERAKSWGVAHALAWNDRVIAERIFSAR